MNRKNRILNCAKNKIRKFDQYTWVGHLTPVEIVELSKSGIIINEQQKFQVEHAKSKIREGRSEPSWFYFKIGKLALDHN